MMTARYGLSPRMKQCLDILREFKSARGRMPSYTEITASMGISARSGVTRLLNSLEERGYIRRLHGKPYAISLVEDEGTAPGYPLPPELRLHLEAYCSATGEAPADFVAAAVQLHLDELGPRVSAADVEHMLKQA